MKPMTIIVLVVAVLFSGWALSDHFPRRANPEVQRLKNSIQYAKARQAAAENKLRAQDQELEHLHALTVHDTAQVRRQKLAYDFGKTHLDTTSTDSLKAQLARADSVVQSQAKAIVDISAERDAALASRAIALKVVEAADYRAERLEQLNAGIQRELDAKNRRQWKHDAKVVVGTLAAVEAAHAVVQLFAR